MIHQYRLNGYSIILDVHSGAVHAVDDVVFDLVHLLQDAPSGEIPGEVLYSLKQKYSSEEIEEAFAEVQQLYHTGMLWSADDYQQFSDKMGDSPVKAMCLHVAHDCNLRCKYCFASTGDFGSKRSLLPIETAKKAIDFLLAHSGERTNLEVDFFGGEPLMNFDVVKQVVGYARSKEKQYHKNFRFTITTNGVLLNDEIIAYLNKEMYNVVLSLDGRPHINDALRPTVNHKGSYEVIVPNYQKLVQQRNKQQQGGNWQYYVRGTFTKHNLDFSADVFHLHELGFDQISIEPVVSEQDQVYAITEAELPRVFAEYEKLSAALIEHHRQGKGFNFFHFMIDLEQGSCAIKRLRGCGSGNEYVAVTPEGDIYPCHQFVGMESWKMGNVHDGQLDVQRKQQFADTTVYAKQECRTCWAKFYCSGGCHANNVQYAGSLIKPHQVSCALQKKRVECALMIKAALYDPADQE